MRIPILNIYYMLVYAWDVLDEAERLRLQAEDCTQLVDLFARVLHSGTEAVLRRGLDRGYVPHREAIAGIRGKIDISASAKANTFRHGRAVCEFDELTYDIQHNRILKSTIRRLLNVPDLSDRLRDELAETHYRLHQIEEIALTDQAFRSLQLHRNNRHYRLLMDVCRLIHQAKLTNEDAGESEFRDFFRDERRMRILFERFVRNFYRHEQEEFRVGRTRMSWSRARGSEADLALLPAMETDTTLISDRQVIVVETKFVPEVMLEHRGKERLRSGHLYQLFAYLQNLSAKPALRGRELSGILLYPKTTRDLDLRYLLHGHRVRVYTLDLDEHWREIERELLTLLVSPPPAASPAQPTATLPE